MRSRNLTIVAVLLLGFAATSAAWACPFCGTSVTLAEQIYKVDASAVVRRVSGVKGTEGKAGSTTVRVESVLHISEGLAKSLIFGDVEKPTAKGDKPPVVDDEIVIPRYYPPAKGTLYVIRGVDPERFVWGDRLIPMSEDVLKYVLASPPIDISRIKRGAYFLKFLEAETADIAQDAYAEFSVMPYEDVRALREKLPREKLRKWIFDEKIPSTRLGLYGLMLGLCGEKTDAVLLEKRILQRSGIYRNGIDGVIAGYLLLTGEQGMEFLEREILSNPKASNRELLAAMQAMRFLWTYGEGRVSKDRLRAAMRLLIARPEVIALAIRDLARWGDWSEMDRITGLYGTPDYDDLATKVAIARYVIAGTKAKPKGVKDNIPPHVIAARRHLETLREKDPKTIRRAEKFLLSP